MRNMISRDENGKKQRFPVSPAAPPPELMFPTGGPGDETALHAWDAMHGRLAQWHALFRFGVRPPPMYCIFELTGYPEEDGRMDGWMDGWMYGYGVEGRKYDVRMCGCAECGSKYG